MNDQLLQDILANYQLTGATAHPLRSYNNQPVFTELIAEHTRRMDRLGLTA